VALNGTADPTTANVILLVYVNGQLWQEVIPHSFLFIVFISSVFIWLCQNAALGWWYWSNGWVQGTDPRGKCPAGIY
jgi:hypothetical protein